MIYYNPTDNDVLTRWISYNRRRAFIMTQLGGKKSAQVLGVLNQINEILKEREIRSLDANSMVTGRDFHTKIWELALSVPIGIAVVSGTMQQTTIANIFYEIGLMNALGKETIVVKTSDFKVPSDFVRTEYISFSDDFQKKFDGFVNQVFEQAKYYHKMAQHLKAKPLLSIDYLRRAYLITDESKYKDAAVEILNENDFDEHTRLMVDSYFDLNHQA